MKLVVLLSSLPAELVGSLVLSNLGLSDIVRLDTAVLQDKYRSDLLAWYSLVHPISSQKFFPYGTTEVALKWLLRRDLNLDKLFIEEANMKLLQIVADSVHKIRSPLMLRIDVVSWCRYIEYDRSAALLSKVAELTVDFCWSDCHVPIQLRPCFLLFHDLKSLQWSTRTEADTNYLIPLLNANAMLRELHIRSAGDRLSDDVVAAVNARADTLRMLALSGRAITDAVLQAISTSCTLLTSFTFSFGEESTVTDAGLCAVIKGCRRLESFTSSFDSSHSVSLTCAFAHGSHLSSIVMYTTLGNEAVKARPSTSTPLRELRCLWGVTSVETLNKHAHVLSSLTNLTIATIVDGRADTLCAALRMMPYLRVLIIRISFPFGAELPTAVLDAIAQGCTLLTKLTVEHKLEDNAERALIAVVRNNPGLVRFKAASNPRGVGFTDAMLLTLAQYCPDIQKIELRYSQCITDQAVIALARSCPKLTKLELPGSVLITDAALCAIAQYRPYLRRLNVDNCTLITEAAVEHLLRSCRKLNFLYISEVILPEESISRLCDEYWVAINVWSPTSEHRW